MQSRFGMVAATKQSRGMRKLLSATVALAVILGIGSVGYPLIDPHIDIFEGFYMTVITITTVGFGEIDNLSPEARPLTLLLIFSGFGLISYVLVAFSQMVFEGEIQRILGRRKLDRMISELKDHVIICGYGKIGEVVCDFMTDYNRPFVVVEVDEGMRDELEDSGYLYVIGDATMDDVLERAGIRRANKLVAATNSDSQNVFIVLTARELNPNLIIHSRAYVEEAEKRLVRAGADKVVFPDKIGGYRMAMGIMRPTFTNFVDVVTRSYEEGEIAVDEMHVGSACILVNKTLFDAKIRQDFNLIIIAIRKEDGSFHFNPGKDTVISEGDTLIAIGLRRDLTEFEKRINVAQGA
jgi:voltage-gated potassium channel